MCVIALCNDDRRLTEAQIEDMFEANAYGAGIAWRDKKGKKPIVTWEKGLDLDGIKALALTVPLPYTAHFRIPTCGPSNGIYPPLCHPFPISENVELLDKGEFEGFVLFHNGSWFDWENKLLEHTIRGGWKLETGEKWSDSRAMAKIAYHAGIDVLDFFKQRIVLFGPEKIFMVGDGWTLTHDKIWVSNTGWRGRGDWRKTRQGGNKSSSTSPNEKEDHSQPQSSLHLRQPQNFQPALETSSSPDGNEPNSATGSLTTTTSTTGTKTTTQSPQIPSPNPGSGPTEEKLTPYRTLSRIPKDATVKQGRGGILRVIPFVRGKKGMRDPSNPEFQVEVTDQVYHLARLLNVRKDSHGAPLLSKSRLKKIEHAHSNWVLKKRQEIQDKLIQRAESQQRIEEGLAKIPMLH